MRTVFGIFALFAALLIWSVSESRAAVFTKVSNYIVEYKGTVHQDDYKNLGTYMEQNLNTTIIRMNSEGGHSIGGYAMGYHIKNYGLRTVVPVGGKCLSACATAFIAGEDPLVAGLLGFHVSWVKKKMDTNDALAQGQWLGSVESGYLYDMGFRNQFATLISQLTKPDTFLMMSSDDLDLFRFTGTDFNEYHKLPDGWLSERVAGPIRLSLLLGGH